MNLTKWIKEERERERERENVCVMKERGRKRKRERERGREKEREGERRKEERGRERRGEIYHKMISMMMFRLKQFMLYYSTHSKIPNAQSTIKNICIHHN